MSLEKGEWILYGVEWEDPECLHTAEELLAYINEVGFLPLFQCGIPGFSVEERTAPEVWWTGDVKTDPWEWRMVLARSGQVIYGKFFDNKAGFVSREWFPRFANYRRDGYDFDARWDDELAPMKHKKIMDLFDEHTRLYSNEAKQKAGYGKGGEKNYDGMVTALQMQTYLCMRDFRRRINKKGEEYGWSVAIYSMPEEVWGHDYVTSAYKEDPEASQEAIYAHLREVYPIVTEKQLKKLIR